jgi:predicted nuclease with TOPRIM domain
MTGSEQWQWVGTVISIAALMVPVILFILNRITAQIKEAESRMQIQHNNAAAERQALSDRIDNVQENYARKAEVEAHLNRIEEYLREMRAERRSDFQDLGRRLDRIWEENHAAQVAARGHPKTA